MAATNITWDALRRPSVCLSVCLFSRFFLFFSLIFCPAAAKAKARLQSYRGHRSCSSSFHPVVTFVLAAFASAASAAFAASAAIATLAAVTVEFVA